MRTLKRSFQMSLRVLALSSPQYENGLLGKKVLTSSEPASLLNACRFSGLLAQNDIGAWGNSNWSGSSLNLRKKILLMHSYREGHSYFTKLINEENPNLILIGSMSICLPGAIECAKEAKAILGEKVLVVLGGWHTSESIYLDKNGQVIQHPSSPLLLMEHGVIDRVFDLVVSGESEYLIAWIGETVDYMNNHKIPFNRFDQFLDQTNKIPGNWILGGLKNGLSWTLKSSSIPIDRNQLPVICDIFGIESEFDVFGNCKTGHVYSELSRGCIYNCDFCSERSGSVGSINNIEFAVNRLFNQLEHTYYWINEHFPNKIPSAFIEDSTLLGGYNKGLLNLVKLIEGTNIDIKFGGQFTIDQIIRRREILKQLNRVGLTYIFTGIETIDPVITSTFNKDIEVKQKSWLDRFYLVIEILKDIGINLGISLLFGLGESRESRVEMFEVIGKLQNTYKMPSVVSINWAVQHPLCGEDGGSNYQYVDWGIPDGPFQEAFTNFGEASLLYPVSGQNPPSLDEVLEISQLFNIFNNHYIT